MKGKVIWIVNQYAGSPRHGMEFRHYHLAREFIRRGASVRIFSGSYSHLYRRPPKVDSAYTFEDIDGIVYCWVDVPAYGRSASLGRVVNMAAFLWRLLFLPLEELERPDAIIVSSPSLFPVINGVRWRAKTGARFILEVRDLWPLTLLSLSGISSAHPLIKVLSWFERYGYARADEIVSVLPNCHLHLEKFGVPLERFHCIPNGIDAAAAVSGTRVDLRKEFPGKFILGYAGTVGIANALGPLVDAARILAERGNGYVQFVVVGDGGEVGALRTKAAGLPNVAFRPGVEKAEVPAVLRQFDACYIGWHKKELYRYGISANKIFDYMLAAKPIVHSVDSSNDPVAEAGCGLTVGAEDARAVAQAVERLSGLSAAARERLGENGKDYVLKNHAYGTLAERYLDLLHA